jgi:prophage regulatory protein
VSPINPFLSEQPRTRLQCDAPAVTTNTLDDAVIREPECVRLTGLSRSTRWRLERAGQFPRRRRISSSCIGWLRSELQAWIAERAKS